MPWKQYMHFEVDLRAEDAFLYLGNASFKAFTHMPYLIFPSIGELLPTLYNQLLQEYTVNIGKYAPAVYPRYPLYSLCTGLDAKKGSIGFRTLRGPEALAWDSLDPFSTNSLTINLLTLLDWRQFLLEVYAL